MAQYKPPAASLRALQSIPGLISHPDTKVVEKAFVGKKFLCELPGGQIYFDSMLQLDSDGSVYNTQDGTGAPHTSTRYVIDRRSMDADNDNYFVLPGGFYQPYGIRKGDIGVVIYRGRKVFACFGDVGVPFKLGEGSIALHRALGHERIIRGRLDDNGIDNDVITIVFPGSGDGYAKHNAESTQIGRALFQELLSDADAFLWRQISRLTTRAILFGDPRQSIDEQLINWMLEATVYMPPWDADPRAKAERLVRGAAGVREVASAVTMSLPGPGKPSSYRRTVYVQFQVDRTPDETRFVRDVKFSLNPLPMPPPAAKDLPVSSI